VILVILGMPKLNLSKLRRQNRSDMNAYIRFGTNIFLEALRAQAVENPDPQIMVKAYQRFYERVFVDSATKEYNRIRSFEPAQKSFVPSSFFLSTWKAWIRSWVIDNLGGMITKVNDNTLAQIRTVLGDAIENGMNPGQTQKLLIDLIGSKKRALAIATTESTRANNVGKERSANDWERESGTTLYKIWMHSGAREPRPEHIAIQNKPIPKNSLFDLGGGMDKPGDLNGGASQTINCRCSVVYISERYARRNYPESF
jgi:hypothetical protein